MTHRDQIKRTNQMKRVVVFPSDEAPPLVKEPERGVVYLWFDQTGRMHVYQGIAWFATPYFS